MSNTGIDWNHWLYRLIAIIIDAIILSIPIWIIYNFLITPIISAPYSIFGITYYAVPWWGGVIYWLIEGTVWVLYSAILDSAWGGTIGKRLLRLQVQTVNGAKVPFDKAFIRNLSKVPPFIIIDWLITVLTPGTDKHQRYLDRIAGTTVVRIGEPFASSASTYPPPPPPPPPT